MRIPTGRVAQAHDLILEAADIANRTGQRTVVFPMDSRSAVISMRQCCYAAQRSMVKQISREAEAEGKQPEAWLREQFLDGVKGEFVNVPPATWPSASILYRCVNGKHYIVFEFRRLASDPLWSDMIKEKMRAGLPEEITLEAKDIIEDFK